MIKLYGKPIRVNKGSQDKKSFDVGANLFTGNLDPISIFVDVDERLLYDTFSAFGVIASNPKFQAAEVGGRAYLFSGNHVFFCFRRRHVLDMLQNTFSRGATAWAF